MCVLWSCVDCAVILCHVTGARQVRGPRVVPGTGEQEHQETPDGGGDVDTRCGLARYDMASLLVGVGGLGVVWGRVRTGWGLVEWGWTPGAVSLVMIGQLQSQPKVSGQPQKKALPRFPSFNVAPMMSTFLSIFFQPAKQHCAGGMGEKGSNCPMLLSEIVA